MSERDFKYVLQISSLKLTQIRCERAKLRPVVLGDAGHLASGFERLSVGDPAFEISVVVGERIGADLLPACDVGEVRSELSSCRNPSNGVTP